jgi:hypothetical protein
MAGPPAAVTDVSAARCGAGTAGGSGRRRSVTGMSDAAAGGRTEWHVNLMGGMKPRGQWRMAAKTVFVSLIGGAELDLTQATLAGPQLSFTKISPIGGLHVRVPTGMRVEVSSFVLFGGRRIEVDPNADGPVLRLRSFALFGGVKVHTDGFL